MASAAWSASFGVWAQKKPPARPRNARIAVLWPGERPLPPELIASVKRFASAMAQRGWVEGRDLTIETRYVPPNENAAQAIEALLATPPDALVAMASPFAVSAARLTTSVPIVFSMLGDPVELKLVDSLARPGRNVTGFYAATVAQAGKRLGLLHEAAQRPRRIGALRLQDSRVRPEFRIAKAAAEKLGVQLDDLVAPRAADFDATLLAARQSGVTAITLMTEPRIRRAQREIAALARKHGLASIAGQADYARDGGLMAYGGSSGETLDRTAGIVAQVLAGTRPADIPVQQSDRFVLTLNAGTARALGLALPKSLLSYADVVIP